MEQEGVLWSRKIREMEEDRVSCLPLQVGLSHGPRQLRALVGRQESAEGRFCGEENETAQHLWVWCSAVLEESWRKGFAVSLRELVETPLRASTLLRSILRRLKWTTTTTAPPRQHLPLRARHNMLFLQRLVISCLYICSTYKIDGICNILSLRALLVDPLSAFNACHRVHNKPNDHRLHKNISCDYRIAFFTWDKDFHLSVVYLQSSSLHCSITHVKTLSHFYLRLWRQNEIITI